MYRSAKGELLVRQIALRFGSLLLEEHLTQRGTGYAGEYRECAKCGAEHRCVDRREKSIRTMLGSVKLHRAYYLTGRRCVGYAFPLDKALGVANERTTPGKRRAMIRAT